MKGFTFIDVLVGMVLVFIVFWGIFGAYQLSLKIIAQSGARVTATAICNQKIEEIRNLFYPEVKYLPEGEIVKTATTSDGKYTITTTIIPVIDPFDGLGDADNCEDTDIDYKRVKVEVSWKQGSQGKVSLSTDVAPKTISQECEETSGVLSVSVVDASSETVPFPRIEIIDPETEVVIATQQPGDGQYNFSLFLQYYKVKITAFGYEEETYGEGEVYYFNGEEITIKEPEKEHPEVRENEVKDIGFQMDELGQIEVETVGPETEGYPIIPGISFTVWGDKLVGRDAEGDPIYKYFHSDLTNASGTAALSELEFDSYYFSISSIYYDLAQTDPSQPIDLLPGENKTVKLILEPENSLLITVLDAYTSDPIFGGSCRLFDLDYDETHPTNEQGQAFFAPLVPSTYNLEVQASGYSIHQEEILISQGEDKLITVELTPI